MVIYQGEELTLGGYLKNDAGERIVNLSGYKISAAMCVKNKGGIVVAWSTSPAVSGVLPIAVRSGGLVEFVLPSSRTRVMGGSYTFEAKLTNLSTGEVVVGISEDDIKVAISNVGSRNDL